LYYARQGLTLSHYDAKAHLVVARRVLDSLTPEYSQIGAVWLPLPHVLNLLPVQIDFFYRTGASAVLISVLSFAVCCYAIARLVLKVTGSRLGATFGAAIFAMQPDILYLQSTPMTEPLLFALTLVSVMLVLDWVSKDATVPPSAAGVALIAACLTRYEAWFVTAALVGLATVALLMRGLPFRSVARGIGYLSAYPIFAILGFFFHSWFTTGDWLVTGGFFVADERLHRRLLASFLSVWYGVHVLTGYVLLGIAICGLCAVVAGAVTRHERASWIVLLSLAAFMVLPTYAFYEGHPFRMRYMIAPTVGVAVFGGVFIGLLRGRTQLIAVAAMSAWLALAINPLNPNAPMVQEAQWDRPFSLGRRDVTSCLMREYKHEPILASMGSLAHYMQELSHEGLGIRDFIHEGNLPYWQEDIEAPKGRVKWILMEERAEGGDVLAKRARESSEFLSGFTRACEGGGVALYKAETEN
jgi:hypothetical protein